MKRIFFLVGGIFVIGGGMLFLGFGDTMLSHLAQISSGVGISVSVPPNPINTLMSALREKERDLNEREKSLEERERELLSEKRVEYFGLGAAGLLGLVIAGIHLYRDRQRVK